MAGRSSQADNRGSDLLGLLASGKGRQFHTFRDAAPFTPQTGLTATGGVINDYSSGPALYRAHIFTSSGTFDVSAIPGDFGNTVEYLVVAGGGGAGGGGQSGGGGAGGLRTNLPGVVDAPGNPLTISTPFVVATDGGHGTGSYTVTVGGGGAGAGSGGTGNNGTPSYFWHPQVLQMESQQLMVVLVADILL